MILLSPTNHAESLEISLADAVTTNQLPYACTYVEFSTATDLIVTPKNSYGTTNNTTRVTVIADAGSGNGLCDQVKYIGVRNKDTAAATVIIEANIAGTRYELAKFALAVNDLLEYEDANGWRILDADGKLKVTTGSGGSGTVNSGAAGCLAVYPSTGTTVDDLALGTADQVVSMNAGGTAHEYKTVTAGTGISVTPGVGTLTIAATASGTISSGTAGRIAFYTAATTIDDSLAVGSANQVLGMNAAANAHEYKTVTAGTGISVTHGVGSVTIANTAGTISSGTTGNIAFYSASTTLDDVLAVGSANQVLGVAGAGSAHEYKTITAGTGISVTHGTNSITIANTGSSPTEATQAEMEAASGSTQLVTPRRVISHPSVPKQMAMWTVSGTTPTIQVSVGGPSIARNGTGDYTLTFGTAFSSANYGYHIDCEQTSGASVAFLAVYNGGRTTGSIRIVTFNAVGTPIDMPSYTITCIGDQ